MVAGLGTVALLAGQRFPSVGEELAQRPAVGVEEVIPEQRDDLLGALQVVEVAGRRVPGKECLQHVHVRVRAPRPLHRGRLEEAARPVVLEMRVEEGQRLLAEPHGVGIAAAMRMRQRQQHAGMVVGVLGGVEDRAVDVEGARPAAALGAAVLRHEVEPVRHQPVGGAVPAALLGHREGIDLAGHGAHPLRLVERRAVHR